jgi:hypothetical protein
MTNNPEKLDALLSEFSKRYFKKISEKEVIFFNSPEAINMLAFAVVMLDIDVQHNKNKDLKDLIHDFQINIMGTNDGDDFN